VPLESHLVMILILLLYDRWGGRLYVRGDIVSAAA
jgi:hypothetical protein